MTGDQLETYQTDLDKLICAPFDSERFRTFVRKYKGLYSQERGTSMLRADDEELRLTYEKAREQRRQHYIGEGKLEEFIEKCKKTGA